MKAHSQVAASTYNDLKNAYLYNTDYLPGKIINSNLSRPIIDPIKTGLNIKKLREENNLTRKELASLLNSSYQTVSNWENSNKIPNIDTLITISKLFNVHVEDLVNDAKLATPVYLDELLDALEKRNWFLTSSKGNGHVRCLKFKKEKYLFDNNDFSLEDNKIDDSIIFDVFKLIKLKKWTHVKTKIKRKTYTQNGIQCSYVKSVKVILTRKYITTELLKNPENVDKIINRLLTLNTKTKIDSFTLEDSITLGKDFIGKIAVKTDENGNDSPYEGIYVSTVKDLEVPFIFTNGNLDGNQYEEHFSIDSQYLEEVLINPFPAIYYTKNLKSGNTMKVKEYWEKGYPQYIIVNDGEYLETWNKGNLIEKRGELPK